MMFRKLYWVTEELRSDGSSAVTGVYTSIPNLIRHGLGKVHDAACLRLSLTKLDSDDGPIAAWAGDMFGRLSADLVQFVATEDITEDQRNSLVETVDSLRSALVR